MLCEVFGGHFLNWTAVFEWHSRFKAGWSVSWRWWIFRATNRQKNDRKCWQNSRTHPQRLLPNNPWARRHRWDQLCSIIGNLNRKFEHAPHCREVCSTILDK
jgi:hypothetical protein